MYLDALLRFILIYVGVCVLYVTAHMCASKFLWRLEEDLGSPGVKVTGTCEPSDIDAEN